MNFGRCIGVFGIFNRKTDKAVLFFILNTKFSQLQEFMCIYYIIISPYKFAIIYNKNAKRIKHDILKVNYRDSLNRIA